ncbi:unnamed protein product [Polarella glacialis]|uniref:Calmodulin n=1 Tax=Polarella glacialis TaxID=89957 RepID=A0A813LXK0_POLGL|nr:unnamed protein product [Polarella glacialis]
MYDRLQKRGVYTDADAASATRQMLRAVGHLHSRSVVHRDVKLENFLYESEADAAQLKLIDFGFAKIWDPSTLMLSSCGSAAYVSPDVLCGRGYTDKCDLWSIGVILWMILAGYPPFHGDERKIMASIKAGDPDWSHSKRWTGVSEEAIDLVRKLLQKAPDQRLDAQQALQHPWLIRASDQTPQAKLSRDALRSLQGFRQASRLRRAVLQLLAQELEPEQTAELRETFLAIDRTNEGTICLWDLKEAIRNSAACSPTGKRRRAFNFAEETESDFGTPMLASGSLGDSTPCSPSGYDSLSPTSCPTSPARTLRRANSKTLSELFSVLDANGDQRIYYSDFLAATMEAQTRLREEAVRATFRRLDADCSGTIGVSDVKAVFGETFNGADVEDFLQEMDPNEDGEFGYEVFARVMSNGDCVPTTPAPLPPKTSKPLLLGGLLLGGPKSRLGLEPALLGALLGGS